ncbi:SMI1/KNR4 family protein [Nocardia sp. NPDC006044]|uniref:SMI1/KNR4 family protein n=1 Tax=Nocardia sp. NPDC006044 TaxID=3364306 RepID=UPI00367E719D
MATFDHVLASFWSDSDYGVLDPLTDDGVRAAENQLGVELPASLLRLLGVQNGGTVADQWNAFPFPALALGIDSYAPFDVVMGVGPNGLLDTPYLIKEWGLPSPIVLLAGDGHWWVGLDYRNCGPRGEPSVTFFDADQENSVTLASDFETFLQGLTAADSFGYSDH